MPRPTVSQFTYGLVTVVVSTLSMLLLSRTGSGAGVAVIALGALGLGLLVAVTVPLPRGQYPPAQAGAEDPGAVGPARPDATTAAAAHGAARRGHGRRRVRVP